MSDRTIEPTVSIPMQVQTGDYVEVHVSMPDDIEEILGPSANSIVQQSEIDKIRGRINQAIDVKANYE